MFDEELDNFVQYMDADGDMGDSSSQDFEAAHQVLSFDNNDSLDEEETERVGGVRGFFFGRKRRRKKQRQQLNSPPKLRNSSTQVQSSSAVATLPVPKAPNTTTSVPLHHRNQHSSSRPLALSLLHTAPSTSTSIPHVIPPSPRDELVPTHHHHHQQQQQQLVELQQPESTSIANFQSFDLDIDTIPVSPRMAPISPFTQDAALQAIDDDNNNNYNASDRNMYEDEDIYFYQDEEPMRPMMLTRNPSWKSATSMVDSVQAEQASSTIMVPHNSSGSVEIVEHRGGTGNHHHTTNANANSTNTNMTLALLQRQGSWTRRLNRRDIYQRHYVPSKQELEEIKELEGYLGVFSSTTRQRFAGLWQQLVPPLADSSISKRSRRNLLERQSSTSSVSSLSSYTQQQQLQQLQLKSTHGNQAFYSIVIKRGPIQFEQYQDYQCEWILLTRGFVVARPNFQFIPRFQAGDLWTSVVQVQPTNPLSITLSCVSRNTALSSSNHLTLTQLKHQQQYGCYTYEVSCETPQEQASWLEAVRKLVIQAHDSAGTNEKEMGGMGWQYRVVYNPFFSEAVTGHPIQKDKILAGSTGHVDLNDLDSYNSYAPLHYATRANHVRVMRFLLEAGADVHVGDGYGRTPMYYGTLCYVVV